MSSTAHRARNDLPGARISNATPYVEMADVHESRVDRSLMEAWSSAAPYLLGPALKWRLPHVVRRVERLEAATAALLYRLSEVVACEIAGRGGPASVDRLTLAVSAFTGASLEDRARLIARVRAELGDRPRVAA